MLTESSLKARLGERPFQFYPSVASTQDIALEWLRSGAESGACVVADEQRSGRGRHGRTWYTPPGVAIALSLILRPPRPGLHQVTMLGALAIYDLLKGLGAQQVGIKWPNDVRLNGRKVSGILPEAAWQGDKLLGVALGMGINVRVDFSGGELATLATSIEPELGRTLDRADLVADLLKRLDFWALRLATPEIFDVWKSRLETLGQPVTVGEISGIAESVDREGALLIRDAGGVLQRMLAGDVLN